MADNIVEIIIYIVIAALILRAVWVSVKMFKKGGCSCGSCDGCGGCAGKKKSDE